MEELIFEGRRHESPFTTAVRWAAEFAPNAPRYVEWVAQREGRFRLVDGIANYQVRQSAYGPVIYRID